MFLFPLKADGCNYQGKVVVQPPQFSSASCKDGVDTVGKIHNHDLNSIPLDYPSGVAETENVEDVQVFYTARLVWLLIIIIILIGQYITKHFIFFIKRSYRS